MQNTRSASRHQTVESKTLISIIIPVYNEELNLPLVYQELLSVTDPLREQFEFIFVDDGSADNSRQVLAELEQSDSDVTVIEFSRNFGKEIAITAGIRASRGEAVIIMDADMQHPPRLIPKLIRRWRRGAEVVVGVRKRYDKQSPLKRFNSWLFYKLLGWISEMPVTPRATDFRLLDRVVVDAFNQLDEHGRMTRGLIDWLGFDREYLYFTSPVRMHGTAGYGFTKLFGLAVNSFVSLSMFPLRFAGWLGIVITVLAGIAGIFMLVEEFVLGDPLGLNFSGPAMLAVLNMFWIGIVLISLGLVALYIASIHAEVVNRPLYIVRPKRPRKPRIRN